ncbi:MAG: hypothetical protein WC488_01455 [Candidatus Micrarchaeia archaeon]
MDSKAAYAAYFKDGSMSGKLNALNRIKEEVKSGRSLKPYIGILKSGLREKDADIRFVAVEACRESASMGHGCELQPLLHFLAESMSHKIWYVAETSADALFLAVKEGARLDEATAALVKEGTSHESQDVRINALFALSIHEGGILNGGKTHLYRVILAEGLDIEYVSSIMNMAKSDWRWGVSNLSHLFGTFPASETGEMLVERLRRLDIQTAMQEPEALQELMFALCHADRYVQLEALWQIRELIRNGLPVELLDSRMKAVLAEAHANVGVKPPAGIG